MKLTKQEIERAKKTVKTYYKWDKLVEKEQYKGYVNPYLGFQCTGSETKIARYSQLRSKAEQKLLDLGYQYDAIDQGFRFVGKRKTS
jgi:hypothetical protein